MLGAHRPERRRQDHPLRRHLRRPHPQRRVASGSAARDATHVSAVARARRGLRRTFQRVQTFGWLSVEDNVLAALEWRGGGGGMFADIARFPTRRARERARRERVGEVLEQCGLTAVRARSGRLVADRPGAHGRVRPRHRRRPEAAAARRTDLGARRTRSRATDRAAAAPAGDDDVLGDAGRARHGLRDGAVRHHRRAGARPGDRHRRLPKTIQEDPLVRAAYLGEGSEQQQTQEHRTLKGDSRETQEESGCGSR